MSGDPPESSTSFGKMPSEVLVSRAFARRLIARRRIPGSSMVEISVSISTAQYHRSSTLILLNSAMCSR